MCRFFWRDVIPSLGVLRFLPKLHTSSCRKEGILKLPHGKMLNLPSLWVLMTASSGVHVNACHHGIDSNKYFEVTFDRVLVICDPMSYEHYFSSWHAQSIFMLKSRRHWSRTVHFIRSLETVASSLKQPRSINSRKDLTYFGMIRKSCLWSTREFDSWRTFCYFWFEWVPWSASFHTIIIVMFSSKYKYLWFTCHHFIKVGSLY